MTEEEKDAIEFLETTRRSILALGVENDWDKEEVKHLNAILNLIEKLKKENQELRVQGSIILLDYNILKDKIREKLERLESQKENYKEQPLIYMLLKNQYKELLEEG